MRGGKLDENKNAVIDLMVLDSSVFLSPVCGDLPIISNEVSSYLDNAIKTVPPSFDVKSLICLILLASERIKV